MQQAVINIPGKGKECLSSCYDLGGGQPVAYDYCIYLWASKLDKMSTLSPLPSPSHSLTDDPSKFLAYLTGHAPLTILFSPSALGLPHPTLP